MKISIPISTETRLLISNEKLKDNEYPTNQLQKGLLLFHQEENLAEEAVGFGVPVLKQGLRTIFAGEADLDFHEFDKGWALTALYKMNLQEKIANRDTGKYHSDGIYLIKSFLSVLHRRLPRLRSFLDKSSAHLRKIFSLETSYGFYKEIAAIKVIYNGIYGSPRIEILVEIPDLSKSGITEVIMMNEQGAHFFNTYRDSDGIILQNTLIGSWSKVDSASASFISDEHRLAFSIKNNEIGQLFKGFELIESRLAWSGFGYSLSPNVRFFQYQLEIGKFL
jgi:hypothetical protein